jgi:alpha-D-xyloside xylohydrolase
LPFAILSDNWLIALSATMAAFEPRIGENPMPGGRAVQSTSLRRGLLLALILICGMILAPASAVAGPVTAVERCEDGAVFTLSDGELRLQFRSQRIVRVWRAPQAGLEPGASLAVIAQPLRTAFQLEDTGQAIILRTGALRISVRRDNGRVAFADAAGITLLDEGAYGGAEFSPAANGAAGRHRVRQAFTNPSTYDGSPQESFFGLGQHQSGLMNLRGSVVHLQQINGDVGLPFILSSKGYGVLWDNPSVTDVHVASPGTSGIVFDSEIGRAADYYFIAGPSPDQVIAGYRALTGAAPMLPRWTWGFWQSKERYQTQDELIEVARRYRSLGVPIDAVVQDWQYWAPGQWGAHRFDPARYSDPRRLVDELHAIHVHAIVSVWPRFDVGTDTGAELERAGALYPPIFTNVYPPGQGRWYDAFNPRARDIYWRQIAERLGVQGWDGYWLDASEAELGGNWGQMREQRTALGSGAEMFNAYPLMHVRGVYEGQRRDFPGKRALVLTRSAWAGQQRYGAITWSGDIHGDWETFRRQIPAGLNFTASGIPYWNTDIGGFFGGDPADPAYRELFIRWFQYGAFNPMFRVHGTNMPKEIWRFDADAQRILRSAIEQRYRLLPYIYSVSWRVTDDGYTMMRPLVMDFAGDAVARGVGDQFMFGPALLINPVTQPGADVRTVYLPAGAAWYDFVTNAHHAGGTTIAAAAPLERLPIFVRAGAILPLGPVVQYADEAPNAPLELRVYRGADGSFTLYDDAGDGYGYERGERATIDIRWSEANGRLSFSARHGNYPGMARERLFEVLWIGPGGAETRQTVRYTGRASQVSPVALR